MIERTQVNLDDVATDVTVGHVGPMASEYVDEGIPFLRSLNVQRLRISTEDIKFISPEFHAKLRKSALKPGDVVIVRTGQPGTCAVIPDTLPVANCSDVVVVRCSPRLRPRFLAYWVNAVLVDHVASHVVGAVQQHFNVGSARKMPILLPDVAEQDRILSLLGAIDDKIELNRRMSAALEDMARSLFRSWFVDFDPVYAKARDEEPVHMDAATAALFPDRFGTDGLPEGWRQGRVSDLVAFNPRETLKKGAMAPYYEMKAVPTSGHRADSPISRAFGSGTKFRRDDVLLARITPCLENGKTALVDNLPPGEVAWGSTEFIVMRGRAHVAPGMVYSLARDDSFRACAVQSMVGSSGRQRVQQERVEQFPVVVPTTPVLQSYGSMIGPMFERMRNAGDEIDTLAALRDSLLPKLMSGELRVRDAERQVEEAV